VQNIRIYQPPVEKDDEASADHARILAETMPFSSTEDVQTTDGRVVKGRENKNHCHFRKVRSLLNRTFMHDLISPTESLRELPPAADGDADGWPC
jgi:cell division control protein 12